MNLSEKQLQTRIEVWQKKLSHLGIGHYRIDSVNIVDETPNGPDAAASVRPSHMYDSVEFWFTSDAIEDCDELQLDEYIVHEWIHVAWRDFDGALDAVEKWMPEATYADFCLRVNHEREGLVERFARQLAASN